MAILCTLDSMFNLDINKRYIVAVSGGADSMALLNMMYEKAYIFKVAHVNYHQRASAKKDEEIVRDFCNKNSIEFYLKDFNQDIKGNFQNQARIFRYNFFKELIEEFNYDAVVVAHHLDDLLETYLIQKQRRSIPEYYGIKKETEIFDVKIIRPLLTYNKQDLVQYCLNSKLEYGEDESNFNLKYTRNKIRHSILKDYGSKEKEKLLNEIEALNYQKQILEFEYKNLKNVLKWSDYIALKDKEAYFRFKLKDKISGLELKEIIRQLNQSKQLKYFLKNQIIIKTENLLKIVDYPQSYYYMVNNRKELLTIDNEIFKIDETGLEKQAFYISDDDFPLVIRNYHQGDKIRLNFGVKKINRFFIDKKIDYDLRKTWPIITNQQNEIIFVYGIGNAKNQKNHFIRKEKFFMIKY